MPAIHRLGFFRVLLIPSNSYLLFLTYYIIFELDASIFSTTSGKDSLYLFVFTFLLIYRDFDLLMVLVSSISDFFLQYFYVFAEFFPSYFNVSLISFNCFSSCFQPGT